MGVLGFQTAEAMVVTFQCDAPLCGRRVRLLRFADKQNGGASRVSLRLPRGWQPDGNGCICGPCHYTKTGAIGPPRPPPNLPTPPSSDGGDSNN